jgi:putative oxidoreductase
MFPNGWPGRGLLVLRLAAGGLLVYDGIEGLLTPHTLLLTAQDCSLVVAGLLLIVGLWTPVAGVLTAVVELWIVLAGTNQMRSAILLGIVGVALAMLGPGKRSIDARLFGRKRIDIRDR